MADEQNGLGQEAMTQVLRQLNQRPIAYYAAYADLMGSVPGGVYLSQVLYWWGVAGDEFYKTDAEMINETRLSAREIRSAKHTLKKLEFITVKAKGNPPVTHYAVDSKQFFLKLASLPNLVKTTKSIWSKRQNQFGQNDKILLKECARQDLKTETTTETTPLTPPGECAPNSPKYSQAFESFWTAYPSKVGKAPAYKSWQKLHLNGLAPTIVADVQARAQSYDQWQRGFIPNPATYLNQRRWEDEWQEKRQLQPLKPRLVQ